MGKQFRIVYREIAPNRYQEEHHDETGVAVVGVRGHIPSGARRIDEEGEREERRLRREEKEASRYERLRSTDPRFGDVQGRMRAEAERLAPEEVQRLDTSYEHFNRRYAELPMEELQRDHTQRKEAIQALQFSHNAMERQAGDLEMLAEHQRFAREKERLAKGDFGEEETE